MMQATAIQLCHQLNSVFDAGITSLDMDNNNKLMADDLIPNGLEGKAIDLAFSQNMTKGLSEKFIKAHLRNTKSETRGRYEDLRQKYKGVRGGWKKAFEKDVGQHSTWK